MKTLVLGYLVPDDLIEELCRSDQMPPMQTHLFMKGFVEALSLSSAQPVDVISALPTNDYPKGPRIWVGFRRWSSRRDGIWWGMPFVNVFPLKHVTRFVSAFTLVSLWCLSHLRQRKCIVVVSAATPQLTAAWLIARLFRAKLVPCLMDPPSVDLATDGGAKKLARRLDRWIAARILARGDGVIAVTGPLGNLLVPNRPAMVFEGAAPSVADVTPVPRDDRRFVAAYAGALGRTYGIPLLLDAYKCLDPNRHSLWLFGKGDAEGEVREATEECENISNFGFVTSGLEARLKSVDLLLMVRPSDGDDSRFVFPSKILYSMALGVPTAITALKGVPAEYFETLFVLDDSSPRALAESIERIAAVNPEERAERARHMAEFVRERKSPRAMGASLYEFLGRVSGLPPAGAERL